MRAARFCNFWSLVGRPWSCADARKNIECFHSRDQYLCKFIGTKESVYIRKEFNSHRIGLEHQHGRRFIVLGHQYGRLDVMWEHSINYMRRARFQSSLAGFSILSQIPSMISLFENWNAIVVAYMKFISSLLRTSWAENLQVGSWNV